MRRKFVLVVLTVFALVSTACEYPYLIDDPNEGAVVSGSTVTIRGDLGDPLIVAGGVLTVNGQVVPVNADRTWSTQVTVDTTKLINIVEARYVDPWGTPFVHRQAVVSGPSLADGQASPNGVGLYFTNNGLASLGPVIESMAAGGFDIQGALAGQGDILNTNFNILPGWNVGVRGNVFEAGMGQVGLATQSTTAGMRTTVTIQDLFVGLNLNIETFGNCKLEIKIPTTTVVGNFNLEPAAGAESSVDVNLVGQPTITMSGLSWQFISGVCDPDSFLIGGLVSDIAGGEVQSAVDEAFKTTLGDPDGSGPQDSVIADAVETALSGLDIAGEVGAAIGVNLAAPIQALTETATGMTLRSNADFFATVGNGATDCPAVANAPNIGNTYDNPSTFPTLSSLTPSGQPYGIGMVISSSAFNQLLEAMAECGAFNSEMTSLDLGTGPIPLTAGVLSLLDPGFASLDPATPFTLKIKPTGAPFVTNEAGPNGEMATLMIPSIELSFVGAFPEGPGEALRVNLDARMGLNLNFDAVNNQLVPAITAGPPGTVTARLTANAVGANALAIETLFTAVFPTFAADLSSSFSAFPLPSFLGLKLSVVQVVRNGNNWVLYSNLTPEPQAHLANITMSDTSDADFEEDDSASDSAQWRHSIRKTQSKTSISTHFRASIGADSATAFDDESVDRTGRYKLSFDVMPVAGQTWTLNLGHTFRGAHTHQGEDGGSARSEFRAPDGLGAHVIGRYRKNGGAWSTFNFNLSPATASSGNGTNQAVAGSNSAVTTGTTQTYVEVEYRVRFYVLSDAFFNWPWDNGAGDEAAIRAGLNDTLTNNFVAGEYPGQGSRVAANDGHFGLITLTSG